MSSEFKQLQKFAYDGIGPLPCSHFTDVGDDQEFAKYQYPHRDGQDATPMRRRPLQTTGEFLFYNGIEKDGNLWPRRYLELTRRLRQPELGYLIHPTRGQVYGMLRIEVTHDVTRALNGCSANFTFEEVSSDLGADGLAVIDPMSYAQQQAAVADTGLLALGISTVKKAGLPYSPTLDEIGQLIVDTQAAIAGAGILVGQLESIFDAATDGGPPIITPTSLLTADVANLHAYYQQPNLTADAINQQTNVFRQKCQGITSSNAILQDPRNAEVYAAILATSAAVSDAASVAISSTPQILSFPLPFEMGPLDLSLYLYEDITHATELLSLNPLRNLAYDSNQVVRFSNG